VGPTDVRRARVALAVMTDPTPEEAPAERPDVLAADRDAEDIANDELPLDPIGPTELGDAVDG
jgi:hypothetical protein